MASPNEIYIQQNTRTSHKRWESMVVYALHYALRDVKIESQFKVGPYLIDAYIPSLKLAIEIDEEHHRYTKEGDQVRQSEIESKLGCKFCRINIGDDVYEQVDLVIEYVREHHVTPWVHEVNSSHQSGEYSQKMRAGLDAHNVLNFVSDFRREVESLGLKTLDCYIRGHISESAGQSGFMIEVDGLSLSVTITKSKKPKLLVTDYVEEALKAYRISISEPCKNGEYYKIRELDGQKHPSEIIAFLREHLEFI